MLFFRPQTGQCPDVTIVTLEYIYSPHPGGNTGILQLSYLTPDEKSFLNAQKIAAKNVVNNHPHIYWEERQMGLKRQDTRDANGNRAAALQLHGPSEIFCLHYEDGKPYNLYNISSGCTLSKDGSIARRLVQVDENYHFEFNNDKLQEFQLVHDFRHGKDSLCRPGPVGLARPDQKTVNEALKIMPVSKRHS